MTFYESIVRRDGELSRQLKAAVEYLLHLQAPSGAWTDFWLPVGTSDAWATAFVGLGVHAAAENSLLDRKIRQNAFDAAQRAAAWLLIQPRPNGGWGYNSQVAPDADSTAYSLSLLARLGLSAPLEAITFLQACRTTGGFRTYIFSNSQHAWTRPCVDVTAAALRALFDLGYLSRVTLAEQWANMLALVQKSDGSWEGYWWNSPSYPTGLVLEIWSQANYPPLSRPLRLTLVKPNAFDLAWAMHAHALLGDEKTARHLALQLLSLQADDGGWPSSPVLHVPPSHPGARGLHDLQAMDAKRLFVTASALRLLSLHAFLLMKTPSIQVKSDSRKKPYSFVHSKLETIKPTFHRSLYGVQTDRLVIQIAKTLGFSSPAVDQVGSLVSSLTTLSLAHPCPFPSTQLSTLAGGIPIEFSVNVGPSAQNALRCVAEVGNPYLAPYPRALSGVDKIARIAQELGYNKAYERILPGIRKVVSPNLPIPETMRFWVWGGLDVATDVKKIEALDMKVPAERANCSDFFAILKIYLNLMDTELGGGRDRLEAALTAAHIPIHFSVREALDRLDAVGFLHELGFGIGEGGFVACKLYYELHGWRRTFVGELLNIVGLPTDIEVVVPEIPGIIRESLSAKSRAGISLRLNPNSGKACALTVTSAFPPPMLTPEETARRVEAWIESLDWESTPYRSLADILLPDWQIADAAAVPVAGHIRMHSLFTRTIGMDGPEATIYLRPLIRVHSNIV